MAVFDVLGMLTQLDGLPISLHILELDWVPLLKQLGDNDGDTESRNEYLLPQLPLKVVVKSW